MVTFIRDGRTAPPSPAPKKKIKKKNPHKCFIKIKYSSKYFLKENPEMLCGDTWPNTRRYGE
jgi:hypothetical protein